VIWSAHRPLLAPAGALQAVVDAAKDGAKVVDLCRLGDQFIVK
jgi:hypothetical protein